MMSNYKSPSNLYKEFIKLFTDTISVLPEYNISRIKRFNAKSYSLNKDNLSILNDYYSEIKRGLLDINTEWNEWLLFIKEFANFIIFIEKCYFFYNHKDNEIYVEVSDINSNLKTIMIYINLDNLDINSSIQFKETKIADLNSNSNNILNFLEDEETSDNVEFVTIEIVRNYGRGMRNEFKFTYGLNVPIKDDSDIILIDTYRRLVSNKIIKVFESTALNIMDNIFNIKQEYYLEEILNNELYLYK